MRTQKAKRVAILVHRHIALFELGCATELFCLLRPGTDVRYQGEVVSFAEEAPLGVGGVSLRCKQINNLRDYDLLVVPCWSTEQQPNTPALQSIYNAVKAFASEGRQILTFCSGSFLPAEIGLLNGRQATTHWRYAHSFQQRFPKVEYVGDVLYTWQGELACSAGSSAAIDLGIEYFRRNHGYEFANSVAKRLVMAPHRQGGQSQFVETPVTKRPDHFAVALDWALANLDKPIMVADLAHQAHLSRRSFDRKFRQSMGVAPKEWLIQQRLRVAQKALESGRETIDLVAQTSGFESSATLRHHFRKAFGISPGQYQKQFADPKRSANKA
ncbi:helix-turn-helix domain-containing protein [Microbulbifer sp. SSSA002]|uniref:helix-turn-helix domain-containing protein n=1 Tax=Microbulbifer sp. SSSA002 TaxID=3243376 RepID=UPI0040391D6A